MARIRDAEGRDLGEYVRIHAGAGELELEPVGGKGMGFVLAIGSRRFGRGGDLEVELPRGTTVSIEATSGEVQVDGIQGPGHYRSASGNIDLRGVRGVLEVSAVSGDVEIAADDEIALHLRTVSGDAKVRAPRISRLGLTTVSGDVRVDGDLAGAGPFSIETLSGDAVVVAYRGVRVDARTIIGEIRSDLDHRAQDGGGRRSLIVGDGASTLAFKSVSGGLRLIAPRAAHPMQPASPREPVPDDPRMDILRALERGELTVEVTTERLADIDREEASR